MKTFLNSISFPSLCRQIWPLFEDRPVPYLLYSVNKYFNCIWFADDLHYIPFPNLLFGWCQILFTTLELFFCSFIVAPFIHTNRQHCLLKLAFKGSEPDCIRQLGMYKHSAVGSFNRISPFKMQFVFRVGIFGSHISKWVTLNMNYSILYSKNSSRINTRILQKNDQLERSLR